MAMKSKCCIWLVILFVLSTNCKESNVCPTIKDYYTLQHNPNCWYEVAAEANVPDVITFYGYPLEEHTVVTPDGYILTMFRIPNYGTDGEVPAEKGPVFLQHGIFFASGSFVALGNQSLAFLLANAGYDVWLGNFRGTEYSEGHVNLTASQQEYWEYSADQLALYDLPTQLEYVAQVTGRKGNIVYIGHSLGSITALGYAATFPKETKEIIKLFIMLAPAAQLSNTKSAIQWVLALTIDLALEIIEQHELIILTSRTQPTRAIIQSVCLHSPLVMLRCSQLLDLLLTGPKSQMPANVLPVFFNQISSGRSVRVLKHAVGLLRSGLRQYDYGVKNKEIYGSSLPPAYDISRIDLPVLMVTSTDDWFLTTKDALVGYNCLSKKARIYGIRILKNLNFSHNDYLYGRNAKSIVYDPILNLLESI